MKRILAWTGYPLLYLGLFILFAYWTFPYDRLKERLEVGFNASQQDSPEPSRLEIAEATWSWRFPGLVLSDIAIIGPEPKPTTEGEPLPARREVRAAEVYARVAPLPLLFGTTDVTYAVDGFGGSIDGRLTMGSDANHLVAEFNGVDPGQLPQVAELLELPLSGSMTGVIDLRLPQGNIAQAEGTVDLEITDLKIGDGTTKIRDLLALPPIDAGTLRLKATTSEGRVKIDEFQTQGEHLEATGEGRIRLREKLAMSLIEQLSLSFKFSDKYRDLDDTTRGLLGKPGDTAPALMDLDPKVKSAKQPDGSYAWRVSGTFGRLLFSPSRATPTAPGGTAPRRPGLAPRPSPPR